MRKTDFDACLTSTNYRRKNEKVHFVLSIDFLHDFIKKPTDEIFKR
jgi:hypothetical protein